jgi:hypothetical protein
VRKTPPISTASRSGLGLARPFCILSPYRRCARHLTEFRAGQQLATTKSDRQSDRQFLAADQAGKALRVKSRGVMFRG